MNILEEVIRKNGAEKQIDIAIEEMAELTQALCKVKRGKKDTRNLAEEMVDVAIMLEQLKIIFKEDKPIRNQFFFIKKKRLERMLDD